MTCGYCRMMRVVLHYKYHRHPLHKRRRTDLGTVTVKVSVAKSSAATTPLLMESGLAQFRGIVHRRLSPLEPSARNLDAKEGNG